MVSPHIIFQIELQGIPTKLPEIEYNDKDITAYTDLDLRSSGDSWQVGEEISF